MKSILISIKPEWVTKILNGEKTIEIRKTMPKCDLPIDVYIYCSKGNKKDWHLIEAVDTDTGWKGYEYDYYIGGSKDYLDYCLEGKVVAKFTLNKIGRIHDFYERLEETELIDRHQTINHEENLLNKSCLSIRGFYKYGGEYAWHIDNLIIFDKPKELSEFNIYCDKHELCKCDNCKRLKQAFIEFGFAGEYCDSRLTKAPQNFTYIEVE